MKKNLILCLLLTMVISLGASGSPVRRPSFSTGFIENTGQITDQSGKLNKEVLYLFQTGNMKVQLRQSGFSYEWFGDDPQDLNEPGNQNVHRIDFQFIGASEVEPLADEERQGRLIYHSKEDAAMSYVSKHYSRVLYKNIYPGIDIEFLLLNQNGSDQFKYNFVIHPGAACDQINMQVSGANSLSLTPKGFLKIGTRFGTMEERVPLSYELDQEKIPGKKIQAKFKQLTENIFGIEAAAYNRKKTLVIDPIVWSTYYGGTSTEEGSSMQVDASGNIYVCGRTASNSNIATTGAHQTSPGSTSGYDGYLAKFSSAGALLWATYYGGSGNDEMNELAIDKDQNVLIAGGTASTSGIATAGSYQSTMAGGNDALLAKFSPSGTLLYATYFGGAGTDIFYGISIDPDGDIATTGSSTSTGFTFSYPNIHQGSIAGLSDVLLVNWSAAGILKWATYYGGDKNDNSYGICTDLRGNIYLTGNTFSAGGMATAGAHKTSNIGNVSDVYIAKFDSLGRLVFGTFYGGANSDFGSEIALDAEGKLLVVGYSSSPTGVATTGAYQTVYIPSSYDALLLKMDTTGVPVWATYYGGSGTDYLLDVYTDPFSNIYAIGITNSSTGISGPGAIQSSLAGGVDAFVVFFDKAGLRLSATYFGGAADESASTIRVDNTGNLYLLGHSSSDIGITTPGSYQPLRKGNTDVYLTKYFLGSTGPITNNTVSADQGLCLGGTANPFIGSMPSGGNGSFNFLWIYSNSGSPGSWVPASGTNNNSDYSPGSVGVNSYYRRIAISGTYADTSNMVSIMVSGSLKAIIGVNKSIQCVRTNNFIFSDLTVSGGGLSSYWDFDNGKTSTNNIDSVTYAPGVRNFFRVRLITQLNGGCSDTAYQNVFTVGHPATKTITGNTNVLLGSSHTYDVPNTNGSTFQWMFTPGTGSSTINSIKIKWTKADTTWLIMVETNAGGCQGDTASLQVIIKDPTGTEEWSTEKFTVYPNPTQGIFYIESESEEGLQIEVLNILGETVLKGNYSSIEPIDLSYSTNGIYILKISNAKGQSTFRKVELMK